MQIQVSKSQTTKSKSGSEFKENDRNEKKATAPVAKFTTGGIQVAVWENEGKEGAMYSTVTLDKRYKSGEEWKSTKSLRLNDLPRAILVLQKAYELLALKGNE